MKLFLTATLAGSIAWCAPLRWAQSAFGDAGWIRWAPRDEIAPRTWVDTAVYLGEPGSLALSGNSNPAVFGGWQRRIDSIGAGKWYRFTAHYRASNLPHESLQVVPRLDWLDAAGRRTGQPEYAWNTTPAGDWKRVTLDARAPEKTVAVNLQLFLQNAPKATVWWDELKLDEIPPPGVRQVKVASVNLRPQSTRSAAVSVSRFLELVDAQVPPGTDVILLPEAITMVGTGKKYVEVAEPVPGPTTARLGETARKKNAYIVGGLIERDGRILYNTAVVMDRQGKLLGRYHKVYLPREEIEGGLTPGSEYPVFRTDFGTVGVMICWDVQYPDPARALALRGAELILVPIWGGNQTLGKARAIENQVFIASSGYDYPTYIMDPAGEILSQAQKNGDVALATIDLNRSYGDKWLGDMRGRMRKERRVDLTGLP